MRRFGFTMLELIFVIVILGIIGKFGVEFLAQAYNNFIYAKINNTLQSNSQMAVNTIAARLQYRIKDSVIKRRDDNNSFLAIGSSIPAGEDQKDYNILEWVGYDIDGFRGDSLPFWSGIIDLNHPDTNSTSLVSPETNTSAVNALISVLRGSGSSTDFNDTAIYFIGSDSNVDGYGWSVSGHGGFTDQNQTMHPIQSGGTINQLIPKAGTTFSGVDVYEYYQLAWTAYAVGISDWNSTGNGTGTLRLYADYQPWNGETYQDANISTTIMNNVSTFQFKSVGSVMKIQVCTKSDLLEEHSLCKEKTIF